MAEYGSLAALRRALTAENADQRAEAYSAVYETDVQPSEVLDSDPDESVVDELVGADVIPSGAASGPSTAEYHEEVVKLLKQVADNTGGAP